jgi:hypothetical protein
VDMNSLLSGLANSQNNACCPTKKCGCGNNNSIIWIIILLCLCGGFGQGKGNNCVYGCKKKHCKKYCKCSCNDSCGCETGCGTGGLGLGGFGGLGSGAGCWWIIILVLLFTCGKQNRGCSNNIINLDNCDEE